MQTIKLIAETPLTMPEYAGKSSYQFQSLGVDPNVPDKGTCFGETGHDRELAVLQSKMSKTKTVIYFASQFAPAAPEGLDEFEDDDDELDDLDDMFGDLAAPAASAPVAPRPEVQQPTLELDTPPPGKRRRRTKEEIAAANGEAPAPRTAKAPSTTVSDSGSLLDFAGKLGRITMFLDELGFVLDLDLVSGLKELEPDALSNAVSVIEVYYSAVVTPVKNAGVHENTLKVLLNELAG
jgi:hypothetical protein